MEPLSRIIFSLYRGSPRHGEWVTACLEGIWQRLLGERLADVCRPLRFTDSKLVVEILDPTWEDALRSMQGMILAKLRDATANEVQQLSFSLRSPDH
jgi:hypothetical protein